MLLHLLRNRTRHLHERIERAIDLPARLASPQNYTALLTQFLGYYAPLEERLAGVDGFDAAGIDFAGRQKAPLLRNDLITLGLRAADLLTLPRCSELPDVADVGAGLGCLYVVEGATLGGQIVRREVEQRFGLTPDRGCSFFASYGERVGVMWQEFCRALEGYVAATPGAEERIITTAVGTFSSLEQWITEGAAC